MIQVAERPRWQAGDGSELGASLLCGGLSVGPLTLGRNDSPPARGLPPQAVHHTGDF